MEARLQYINAAYKYKHLVEFCVEKKVFYGWIIYRKIQNIDRNLIRWTNGLVAGECGQINEGVGNSLERNYFSEHKE